MKLPSPDVGAVSAFHVSVPNVPPLVIQSGGSELAPAKIKLRWKTLGIFALGSGFANGPSSSPVRDGRLSSVRFGRTGPVRLGNRNTNTILWVTLWISTTARGRWMKIVSPVISRLGTPRCLPPSSPPPRARWAVKIHVTLRQRNSGREEPDMNFYFRLKCTVGLTCTPAAKLVGRMCEKWKNGWLFGNYLFLWFFKFWSSKWCGGAHDKLKLQFYHKIWFYNIKNKYLVCRKQNRDLREI